MAAAVVADDAEVARQLVHLRLPQAQIGAEGVDEHQRIGASRRRRRGRRCRRPSISTRAVAWGALTAAAGTTRARDR